MEEVDKKAKNASISKSLAATKDKRKTQSCHVFQIKIQYNKLSKQRKSDLHTLFVEAKWLGNAILNHAENGNKISSYDTKQKTVIHLDKDKNHIESEFRILGSQIRQSVLESKLASIKSLAAKKKKGSKVGKLKFKSDCNSVDLKQFGVTYDLTKNKVRIQGIKGWMKVNGTDQFFDKGYEIANAKLLKTPRDYYLAVTCYKEKVKDKEESKPKDMLGEHLGIDLGCETTVTFSDGRKFKAKVKESNRLKRLQRKLSRQEKRSKRWFRTKRLIGVEHQKNTARKDDRANKIVHETKRYTNLYMQDELLSKWQSNGHGKAVSHSVLGRVKSKCKKFAAVVLPPEAKTTQLCYKCDKLNPMPLGKRIYTCSCGILPEDRDVHSAKDMVYISLGYMPELEYLGTINHREFKRRELPSSTPKRKRRCKSVAMKCEAAQSLDEQ